MSDLHAIQRQWDEEARTIDASKRAFIPDRPKGEPSMLAGVAAGLTIFAMLGVMWALLPA